VALRRGERWLLHCGDAFFNHREVDASPSCPPVMRFFQAVMASDGKARRANRERLRELASRHGDEVDLVCAHDPHYLERHRPADTSTA
jgi:hypothetical protein